MTQLATTVTAGPFFEVGIEVHDRVVRVRCEGTLDETTAPRLSAAVEAALGTTPRRVRVMRVDVTDVEVEDAAGARALAAVQRQARGARVELRWQGLAADHLRGLAPVRYRARPAVLARALLTDLPMTLRQALAGRRPGEPGRLPDGD